MSVSSTVRLRPEGTNSTATPRSAPRPGRYQHSHVLDPARHHRPAERRQRKHPVLIQVRTRPSFTPGKPSVLFDASARTAARAEEETSMWRQMVAS
jgi:hypothetical protein